MKEAHVRRMELDLAEAQLDLEFTLSDLNWERLQADTVRERLEKLARLIDPDDDGQDPLGVIETFVKNAQSPAENYISF